MAYDPRTEELARLATAGDAAALDVLLVRIQPDVLRQCRRFLPCGKRITKAEHKSPMPWADGYERPCLPHWPAKPNV